MNQNDKILKENESCKDRQVKQKKIIALSIMLIMLGTAMCCKAYYEGEIEGISEKLRIVNNQLKEEQLNKADTAPQVENSHDLYKEELTMQLITEKSLIKEFSVLGGEAFFIEESLQILSDDVVRVDFEDGHMAGKAYVKYNLNEDSGLYEFELIGADI